MRKHTYWIALCALVILAACNKSPSNQQVVVSKEIPKLYPDIFETGLSVYEKSNELRRRIARIVNTGNFKDSTCSNYVNIPFHEFDPSIYIKLLQENRATVLCDLTSKIYVKILNDNGIEAYAYNFGLEMARETHVASIVKISDAPEKWIVQDAHFNYTILDTLGEPKDFLEFLTELKAGELRNIATSKDTVHRELLVDVKKEDMAIAEGLDCEDLLMEVWSAEDTAVISIPVNFDHIHDQPCILINTPLRLEHALEQKGMPANFFYAYSLQIGKVWGPYDGKLQESIDKVLGESLTH